MAATIWISVNNCVKWNFLLTKKPHTRISLSRKALKHWPKYNTQAIISTFILHTINTRYTAHNDVRVIHYIIWFYFKYKKCSHMMSKQNQRTRIEIQFDSSATAHAPSAPAILGPRLRYSPTQMFTSDSHTLPSTRRLKSIIT